MRKFHSGPAASRALDGLGIHCTPPPVASEKTMFSGTARFIGDDRVQIALLVSEMNVNGSFFNIENFIRPEVFVRWEFVPWCNVLSRHDKVLRTIATSCGSFCATA